MQIRKPIVLAGLLAALFNAASHAAPAPGENLSTQANPAPDYLSAPIDRMERLPIDGVMLVESGGKTYIISSNGRFIFQGKLYDVIAGVVVDDIYNIEQVSRIDWAAQRIEPATDFRPLTVGQGEKIVYVFTDPLCPECRTLFEALKSKPDLTKTYTFAFILLPGVSDESKRATVQLACARDRQSASIALLSGEPADIAALEVDQPCDKTPLQRGMVTAKVLGITQIPSFVRHDGVIGYGRPSKLDDWLAGAAQSTPEVK